MAEAAAGRNAGRVVVGMDPHKRSVTIEVMAGDEAVLGGGRFATTTEGYRAMRAYVARWPDRVWAIEGCAGIGGHVATRLLADGEQVLERGFRGDDRGHALPYTRSTPVGRPRGPSALPADRRADSARGSTHDGVPAGRECRLLGESP